MKQPIITINVVRDFSRFPGGRYKTDGPHSAERLRDDLLVPALGTHKIVVLEMDGARGYPRHFLEETFGGLVWITGLSATEVKRRLRYRTENPEYRELIDQYIDEESRRRLEWRADWIGFARDRRIDIERDYDIKRRAYCPQCGFWMGSGLHTPDCFTTFIPRGGTEQGTLAPVLSEDADDVI